MILLTDVENIRKSSNSIRPSAQSAQSAQVPSLLCNLTLAPTPLSQLRLLTEHTALLCHQIDSR